MPRDISDSVQGTLDFLILKALSWEEMHGYGITRWLREQSGGEFRIEEGTLYPALHRLESRGLVRSSWGVSENNRRAKYYALLAEGRRQLERETETWARFSRVVGQVLSAAPEGTPAS